MTTILYVILIYILTGSIVYLIAIQQSDKELTPFKKELFLLLGFIFKPTITVLLLIDGYVVPTIKQKNAIRFVNKQYNKQLKKKNLTDEQRQVIIHKRDSMVDFLRNVSSECDYDEE